ncbi:MULTISPECIES: hypothetical protein [Proteiniphilum]|jgi:hypothetical protein|uniref:hypothetical protein n=1 Tax=Proteiniphilum TaxID=294702 RepID=UPI001EEB4378|nr:MULTISPECIES: hypothetical protein [Proteiniphilum]ULB35105.1 hypothetical protein KDN43_03420 [Proteiniphilum propionicum]
MDQLDSWPGIDQYGRDYVVDESSSLTIRTCDWKYTEPNNGSACYRLANTELGNRQISSTI